jgi:hypothetical protein
MDQGTATTDQGTTIMDQGTTIMDQVTMDPSTNCTIPTVAMCIVGMDPDCMRWVWIRTPRRGLPSRCSPSPLPKPPS